MTAEDKNLLLKDLCVRLPYHPRINVVNQSWEGFKIGEFDSNLWMHHLDALWFDRISIAPYLRPMSSMTEEEKKELGIISCDGNIEHKYGIFYRSQDWLNAHHFDYRGLIEKGLALEAKHGMY